MDDFQKSIDELLGNKPKHGGLHWLALGILLGIFAQIGPGAVAGWLSWSPWWAVAWGAAIAFHSCVIKSNIGKWAFGLAARPRHWLYALVTVLPGTFALFAILNLGAYWIAHWLANR